MRFQRPCLDCGTLSMESRCEKCSNARELKFANSERGLARRERKRSLYGYEYQKRSKPIRESATNCYLCGDPLPPGGAQVDHVFPSLGTDSPLAPAHGGCNRKKSGKDYDPNQWKKGLKIARLYIPINPRDLD